MNPDDLAKAIRNSAAWIRAVLQDEHVPEDIEEHIVGIVDDIEGYDVTRVEFQSETFRFLVTQEAFRIVGVLTPIGQDKETGVRSRTELEQYLAAVLGKIFKHASAMQSVSRFKATPLGVEMTFDDRLCDEEGVPLSTEERRKIAQLPQPEQSDAINRLKRIQDKRLHEIDPTLPARFVGGATNYWWGLPYATTDGRVVVFSAPKAYGGSVATLYLKDWFRKEKLPHLSGRRYKSAPWPPEDTPFPSEP